MIETLRRIVFFVLITTAIPAAFAQTQFWAGLGSFRDVARAERELEAARDALQDSYSIVPSETANGYVYRVLSGPLESRDEAQARIATAKAAGFGHAWLLATSDQTTGGSSFANDAPDVYDVSSGRWQDLDDDLDSDSSYHDEITELLGPTETDDAYQSTPDVELRKRAGEQEIIEEAPEEYRVHKLRRDARAGPASERGPPGAEPTTAYSASPRPAPIILPRFNHADTRIEIDGLLTESEWTRAKTLDDFVTIEPDTLAEPPYRTVARLLYTERGLYVSFELEQPADSLVRWLSARDKGQLNRDHVGVILDTSGTGRYGYWIGLALGDNQFDGTLRPERELSDRWDAAWYGATAETPTGWAAEIFLPWSQTAMPKTDGSRQMGLYVSRKMSTLGERWAIPALPPTQAKFISAMRPIQMEGVNPRQQWSLFPFASVTYDELDDKNRYKVGADVFWRPSTNFQLTGTVNPDFGNVESDDVIVNLTAFETFFPEKRLFFLEGQEIFVTTPRADPDNNREPLSLLNTRRIGGKPRPPDAPGVRVPLAELSQPAELLGAAKFTGQAGGLRFGALGAMEDDVQFHVGAQNIGQSGSDYGVARVLYESSSGGGYRSIGWLGTAALHPDRDALVHGIDAHYLSDSGRWKWDSQFLYSDVDDDADPEQGQGYGGLLDLVYTQRRGLKFTAGVSYFDDRLDINDLGFLRRNDALNVKLGMQWVRAGIDWAREALYQPFVEHEWNDAGEMVRSGFGLRQRYLLNNLARLELSANFFPKRFEDRNSFGNGSYRIEERPDITIEYESDTAMRFSYWSEAFFAGEQQGGAAMGLFGGIRWRPRLGLNLNLWGGYIDRDGWLLHQEGRNFTTFQAEELEAAFELDYFPSARHQFRLALQWIGIRAEEDAFFLIPQRPGSLIETDKPPGPSDNFALSQLSFQARYRWQIAPLSDLFVVYTRNGLRNTDRDDFGGLFESAFNDPLTAELTVKLRYRFGS